MAWSYLRLDDLAIFFNVCCISALFLPGLEVVLEASEVAEMEWLGQMDLCIYIYYMKQVVYIHWEWNGMTWNMNTLGNVWCDVLRFWMFISRLQGAACHARPPVTWSSVEFRIWDLKKLRVELSWLQMFTRQSPNIAMEQNTIFDGIYKERPGFSVAVLVYRRVYFIRFVDFSQRLLQAVRTCWPVV